MAVLALRNWGCNAPEPLWSSRLPIPIRSPHQFMKLSHVKISSRIESASKFLILKHFNRHNKVIIFIVTIFLLHHAKLGVQSRKLGMQLMK